MTPPLAGDLDADPWKRVVAGWWLLLTVSLFGYVAYFGPDLPFQDEWTLLPPLVGEHPLVPWLLERHNEHFYPLPRLVWYTLHQVSGGWFKTSMFASVGFASWAAWLLLRTTRKLRGRSAPADLLVPALLLHLGHWENWFMGYQVAFTLPVALAAGAVALLAEGRRLRAGALTLLTALCGGAGVLLAVPLALVALCAAWVPRPRRPLVTVPALLVIGYAVFCVVSFDPPAQNPRPSRSTPVEKLVTVGELGAGVLGAAGRLLWPVSVVVWVPALMAVGWIAVRRGPRADGLVVAAALAGAFGAAGVLTAIAISRTGMFPHVGLLSPRYAVFSAFGAACVWVALVAAGRSVGRWGGGFAAFVAVAVVAANLPYGIECGKYFRHISRTMRTQARQGESVDALAAQWTMRVYKPEDSAGDRAVVAAGLKVMQRHGFGPFRSE